MPRIKQFITLLLIYFLSSTVLQGQDTTSQTWWKETVFYQIYMPSFQDSDGNGYSDFAGMTSRLDYIKSLGVRGIWLTPFLESPKIDNGYDVANYYKVDSIYGDLDDFQDFLEKAHDLGLKVIMDMVVNHTSTECSWFKESRKSLNNPYRDYYIWKEEPNNWESFFGGPAWEKDTVTNEYYYHKFDVRMADLNWSNPVLVDEIKNVLRFWLDKGVDGFRMDVINFLVTDGIGKDNPVIEGKQQHIYDIDQAGVKDAMREIKSTIGEYEGRFIVGEIGSDKLKILSQYQGPELMDVVFNFNFGSIAEFSTLRILNELEAMEDSMPGYPTLFFGSHDMPRLMNRLASGEQSRAGALAALMLTARGVPFIYYGDEVGMENIVARSIDEIVDIQGKIRYNISLQQGKAHDEALVEGNSQNRDKSRSPMQWDTSYNAGFSIGKPWIKVNENYHSVNVLESLPNEKSLLNTYKALISLRNSEKTLQYGSFENLVCNDHMLQFTRTHHGDSITIVINFGKYSTFPLSRNSKILFGKNNLDTNEVLIYRHPLKQQ